MGFEGIAGKHLRRAVQAVGADLREKIEDPDTNVLVSDKPGYAPDSSDISTQLDGVGDCEYRRRLEPFGPVQSEDGQEYAEPGQIPDMRYVIDAVDGTRSLAAGMHALVGTMGAAVNGQEAYAAFVASVMTGEMIGFDCADESGGMAVDYQLNRAGTPTRRLLFINHLKERRPEWLPVQVRRGSRISYSRYMENLLREGLVFKHEQRLSGSFGLGMFPLWRGEVAAQVIPGSYFETPWDNTPVFAICRKLGIRAFAFSDKGQLLPFEMEFLKVKRPGTEILLVHGTFVMDLLGRSSQFI